MNKNVKIDFRAFTLAEVLITLGIIGIVAAITIPPLIANNQKNTTVTRLRGIYSILNQAYSLSVKDNGEKAGWSWPTTGYDQAGTINFVETNFLPYLKINKNCGYNNSSACFSTGKKFLNGSEPFYYYGGYQVILNNGVSIDFMLEVNLFEIVVDVNGNSGPNLFGKDIFFLALYKNNSKPIIFYGQGIAKTTLLTQSTWGCNISVDTAQSGTFCGAVILNDGWQIASDYPW